MNFMLNLPRHYYDRLIVGLEATPPKKYPYGCKRKTLGNMFYPLSARKKQISPSGFSFTQGRWNWGCQGCTCTPYFFQTKKQNPP